MDTIWSLGLWIKRRRRALDLSQAQLADLVGCSVVLVSKIEGDARRPSRELALRMARHLALPDEVQPLFVQAARGLLSADRLPYPTSFLPMGEPADAPPASGDRHSREAGALTFLVTDIVGAPSLWEQRQVAMRAAHARYEALVRTSVAAKGGVVFKVVDEAIRAVFADPSAALGAALDAQRFILQERWVDYGFPAPLAVRMALHSGLAEEASGDFIGPPVGRSARLCEAAHGGQVLVSRATAALLAEYALPDGVALRGLGDYRLKDLSAAEPIYQAVAAGLPGEFAPPAALTTSRTNLPAQPTQLLGRAEELAHIIGLVRRPDVRLLTLTGAGGTGKTRLALQAAADSVDSFADGVWFVDLATSRAPIDVAPAVVRALELQDVGQQPESLLRVWLRERHLLLLLDNCEQVAPAVAALVAELLAAAEGLTVLVTSRVPLHVRAEHLHAVPPLQLPARVRAPGWGNALDLAALIECEAVALFIARAEAVDETFVVTSDTAPVVAEICWRLDGLPLAIELAAARVGRYHPAALLSRLEADGGLGMLTGGARDLPARQQTLRATIDWSYRLLALAEQALLARLGVFAGSFDATAALAVYGSGDGDVHATEALLDALVEQNLLVAIPATAPGAPRFRLLETVRAFAREQLAARGEQAAIEELHAAQYLALAEVAESHLRREEQLVWLSRIDQEYPNIEAALAWAFDDSADERRATGLRLAGALWYYWFLRGRHGDAYRWLEHPAAHVPLLPAALRARALLGASFISNIVSWRSVVRQRDEGYALACEVGDPWLVLFGRALSLDLGERVAACAEADAWAQRDPWLAALVNVLPLVALPPDELMRDQADRGLTLARHAGDRYLMVEALCCQCELAYIDGHVVRLEVLVDELRAVAQSLGSDYARTLAEVMTFMSTGAANQIDTAIETIRGILVRERKIGNVAGVSAERLALIGFLRLRGDLDEASALLDDAAAIAAEESPDHGFGASLRYHATYYWQERIQLCVMRGDFDEAQSLLPPSAEWPPDDRSQIFLHLCTGLVALARGGLTAAAASYGSAIAIHAGIQWRLGELTDNDSGANVALARAGLCLALLGQGDLAAARAELAAFQPRIARCPDVREVAWLAHAASRVLLAAGDPGAAGASLASALQRAAVAGAAGLAPPLLEQAAAVAAAQGRHGAAACWLAAVLALRERLGAPAWPSDRPGLDRLALELRGALGGEQFEAAWDAGASMPWQQAASEAAAELAGRAGV